MKAAGHVFNALGEEREASGSFGHFSQHVIAPVTAGTDVGADGVDNGFGALAHFNSVVRISAALIIVSVGDQDQRLTHRTLLRGRRFYQLVPAGSVNGVEE